MNFQAPDFYLMGSISTRRSNSQFSNFFETSACTYYHDKKNIRAASQLLVCTCRILSFIEHVYCFFRSSEFQLGCRLSRVGFVFNRPSPWRQRGTKIQQVSTGLWPASVSYICLTTSAGSFVTESNTQPSSIFLLKRMSYIRFLISTYSFASSYTRIIILKIHKFTFHIYILIFVVIFPPSADFFTTGFPLNQLNCPTSYLLTKTKRFFWQINKFLKKCLSFRDYNSSDSTEICKIRLNFLTVVLGRKWAVINYLRISKWAANY